MSSPGITKTLTLGAAWQRLGTLFNSDYPTELREGNQVAYGCYLYVDAQDAEVVFADSLPGGEITKGHVMDSGDSAVWGNQAWISRAWFRNKTAASNATLVVTPIFNL